MFFHLILLIVSLMSFLRDLHVFSCDFNCADKPVFTPSRLVVKYGDPTSAKCTACQHACLNGVHGLEKSVGQTATNGTTILWRVDRMTEWDTPILCYYSTDAGQCCTELPVTVYQPPDNVSISFVDHSGPMLEGHQYTLQCTVQNVAPAENLTVTFYRGQTALGQLQSNNNMEKKPVTESFTFNISPTNKDDGVQYWCEAKLQLGPGGPQPPPVLMSQNITATVHYKPHQKGPSHPDPINVTVREGTPLRLNCAAEGNPSPSYTWVLPSNIPDPSSSSVFNIDSVALEHKGRYTCLVSNDVGAISVNFAVAVQEPPDVSISFVNHSAPMLEGHQYTLQCTVQNVAPAENLTVTFYRGQTALRQLQSNNNMEKKPVNESFTFNISPTNKDDGVQYWCEANLQLGPDGPQPPLVLMSQNITATVHYKPHQKGPSHPDPIIVREGTPLRLNCTAEGNPSPSYTWKLPSNITALSSSSVFNIDSVALEHKGRYTCLVSNDVGAISVNFAVAVQGLKPKTTTTPRSSTSSILIDGFIMCFMVLFSALLS